MPNKKIEWHVIDILTEYLKEKEGLDLKPIEESESPDFLIQVKEETIGVEVTRFSTQGDQFELNSLVDKALEHGRQEFRDNGGPALYVSVHFSCEPETTNQAKDIGKRLARVVQIMLEHNLMDSSANIHEVLFSEHRLLDYVSHLSFLWSVDGKDELWQSSRSGWVASISSTDIQKIIERKNKKLPSFYKNCKSVWLVIYNCIEAGFYAISNEAKQFIYSHGFDRIFWIELRNGNPISLNDSILPAIRENMPKSRTDVFQVYELRMGSGN